MKLSIGEMARISGVTVRGLHYYDQVGLLRPSALSDAGYRFYAEEELARLQQILLLKTLDFSLDEIAVILDAPAYDQRDALQKQRALLTERKANLDKLITFIDQQLKGDTTMDFTAFDQSNENELKAAYAKEARARYGETAEYKESQKREKGRTKAQTDALNQQADEIFKAFAELNEQREAPQGEKAAALVRRWQAFITAAYYPCTDEILASLAEMYVADERFTHNLDRFGAGTAAYMRAAILAKCQK